MLPNSRSYFEISFLTLENKNFVCSEYHPNKKKSVYLSRNISDIVVAVGTNRSQHLSTTISRKNDELNWKTNTFNIIRFFQLPRSALFGLFYLRPSSVRPDLPVPGSLSLSGFPSRTPAGGSLSDECLPCLSKSQKQNVHKKIHRKMRFGW